MIDPREPLGFPCYDDNLENHGYGYNYPDPKEDCEEDCEDDWEEPETDVYLEGYYD